MMIDRFGTTTGLNTNGPWISGLNQKLRFKMLEIVSSEIKTARSINKFTPFRFLFLRKGYKELHS